MHTCICCVLCKFKALHYTPILKSHLGLLVSREGFLEIQAPYSPCALCTLPRGRTNHCSRLHSHNMSVFFPAAGLLLSWCDGALLCSGSDQSSAYLPKAWCMLTSPEFRTSLFTGCEQEAVEIRVEDGWDFWRWLSPPVGAAVCEAVSPSCAGLTGRCWGCPSRKAGSSSLLDSDHSVVTLCLAINVRVN